MDNNLNNNIDNNMNNNIANNNQINTVEQNAVIEPKIEEVKPATPNQKGNKKGSGIIIAILLIVILGLGAYIAYDKFLSNTKDDDTEEKTTTNNNTEEKVENLDVTSKEVTDLLDSLTHADAYYCGVYNYFTDKKVTASDLESKLVSLIALYNIRKNGKQLTEGTTITKSEMGETVKKLFGKNYKFTYANIDSCPSLSYDASKETYTVLPSACGGTCGPTNYKRIVKATKTDSKIELNIRMLFRGDTDVTNSLGRSYPKYYKDFNKTIEVELARDNDNVPIETNENYQKGSLYKMIFTNEDGNYVFTSSELVNE